jgi:hypothetical protein
MEEPTIIKTTLHLVMTIHWSKLVQIVSEIAPGVGTLTILSHPLAKSALGDLLLLRLLTIQQPVGVFCSGLPRVNVVADLVDTRIHSHTLDRVDFTHIVSESAVLTLFTLGTLEKGLAISGLVAWMQLGNVLDILQGFETILTQSHLPVFLLLTLLMEDFQHMSVILLKHPIRLGKIGDIFLVRFHLCLTFTRRQFNHLHSLHGLGKVNLLPRALNQGLVDALETTERFHLLNDTDSVLRDLFQLLHLL